MSEKIANSSGDAGMPAYRLVFETIEREMMEGTLRVGDRLPTETDLAARFGMNRSTTREGLRLLEESGLVERRKGRRLYAAAPRARDLSMRARRALILQGVTFDQLWRVLSALEPAAAEAAAEMIRDEDFDALEDNIRRTHIAAKAGLSLTALDIEFHALVAGASRNGALVLAREPAAELTFSANERMLPHVPQAGARLIEAHENILDALKAGDGAAAAAWMRRHVDDFRRGYELAGLDLHKPIALGKGRRAAPARAAEDDP